MADTVSMVAWLVEGGGGGDIFLYFVSTLQLLNHVTNTRGDDGGVAVHARCSKFIAPSVMYCLNKSNEYNILFIVYYIFTDHLI